MLILVLVWLSAGYRLLPSSLRSGPLLQKAAVYWSAGEEQPQSRRAQLLSLSPVTQRVCRYNDDDDAIAHPHVMVKAWQWLIFTGTMKKALMEVIPEL
jgi:hypothetical protein